MPMLEQPSRLHLPSIVAGQFRLHPVRRDPAVHTCSVGNRLLMQRDGNLVEYIPGGRAVRASNTAGQRDPCLQHRATETTWSLDPVTARFGQPAPASLT